LAQEGLKEIPSRALGERVMQCLKDVDEVAYVRFASVYKSFRDIDEFIREMSKLVSGRTIE
jgi:transcriptional repressor NrdR